MYLMHFFYAQDPHETSCHMEMLTLYVMSNVLIQGHVYVGDNCSIKRGIAKTQSCAEANTNTPHQ